MSSLKQNSSPAGYSREDFREVLNGREAGLYILKNNNGLETAITSYGGRVVSLLVPDKSGRLTDVVLGHPGLAPYRKAGEPYFGALIGRYGNRIARGRFTLEGTTYQLAQNNGPNALHGGPQGFHAQVWKAVQTDSHTLQLGYTAQDGEEGYPGTLDVQVNYCLNDDNALEIVYQAVTDKTTILNLTNHTYFNLDGEGSGTVHNQVLTIYADRFTPVDETLIPTGELRDVTGTPFDFREPTAIGARIDADDEQIKAGKGYDHNFVLSKGAGDNALAARVKSLETGIVMEVFTTEPGVQFYSGNFLDGKDHDGKGGKAYPHRSGFCLETQHFPDSPNQPAFPSVVLRPGETYRSATSYLFTAG